MYFLLVKIGLTGGAKVWGQHKPEEINADGVGYIYFAYLFHNIHIQVEETKGSRAFPNSLLPFS